MSACADYLAGDSLEELKLRQQWQRPSGCKKTQHRSRIKFCI